MSTSALQLLLEQLDLERIEDNLFRGQSSDMGGFSVFGGHVLGQALVAAQRTVSDRYAHSLHAYFLRPGDMKAPIVYEVDRIRDGSSFTTRRVVAIQHGRPIFNMSCSFQLAEQGVEHQNTMPAVPPPEELSSEQELRLKFAERVPQALRKFITRELAIEMRPVNPVDPLQPQPREPFNQVWLRTAGELPTDLALHQALLAYASDFNFMGTALMPHGLSFMQGNLQGASIDHVMWFHRPFRIDDWVLYSMDSPSASNARGFNRGAIYTRDGGLVASTAQEGLMRIRAS
jgi:acyl-CoA thioesterase-2